jgi:hypothetical protein
VKPWAYTIGTSILVGVTLLGGMIQGHISHRWARDQEFEALASRLRELPEDVGPWRMKASTSLPPDVEAVLECAGYVNRQYENRQTHELVAVIVLLGPAGPISVHTPDVCYSSQAYTVVGSPARTAIAADKGSPDELWCTSLRSRNLTDRDLRVYHGWTTGGAWSAPEQGARLAFAGQPYLYKLQVVGPLPTPVDDDASDQCRHFLNDFLPALRPYLVKPEEE